MPARLAGEAVEQAVKPRVQPGPAIGKILDRAEYVTVTCDLADGEITSAVIDVALDRLAEQLKNKATASAG